MKRGTPRHRKMRDLAKRLCIPLAHAVGVMEMLWHWAGQETPEGDIGLAEDREIAAAADWAGDAGEFVEALVSSKWLDRHEDYRLIIHDWPDHADNAVRRWLDRNGKTFLSVYGKDAASVHDSVEQNCLTTSVPRAHARAGLAGLGSSEENLSFEVEGVQGEALDGGGPRGWRESKFDEFWGEVWLKTGKGAAKRAFMKAAKTPTVADQIIAACREQGRSILEHAATFKHSVLHPSTWLNEGRFFDEPQSVAASAAPKSAHQILAEKSLALMRQQDAEEAAAR